MTVWRFGKFFVIIIVFFVVGSNALGDQIKVFELLDRYESTRSSQKKRIEKTDYFYSQFSSKRNNTRYFRYVNEYRTDGERADYLENMYWSYTNEEDIISVSEEKAIKKRRIWDGDMWYSYNDKKNSMTVTIDEKAKKKHFTYGYGGARLDGLLHADFVPASELIRQAKDAKVREQKESVNGVMCYVIEADTKNGDYTLWLDPEHGYNIAKASVRKSENDYKYGRQLKGKETTSFELSNVRFELVDDVWVAVNANYESKSIYGGGQYMIVKASVKRSAIDLNPDFEAVKAFVPDFPDGARVFNMDNQGTWVTYEWRDGRIVPYIGE